jgi:DNA-binding NarL/FixJ family response regulator
MAVAEASDRLSAREREVLEGVRRGMTDAEIAAALVVSPRTVNKHLERIYRKLGVHNRTSAVLAGFPPARR